MSAPIVDREEARARILSHYTDPDHAPFEGAVRTSCDECGSFIIWSSPPACSVPTMCEDCSNP